ncbi:MAG: hypothetical protein KatS3mg108_2078 [Isosphaeraceae bacterium]|jgi:hypothetical protein|nr:MAG: hypothetical protein KatS3mg108_2078 [Isosphaeraceae bacterium]
MRNYILRTLSTQAARLVNSLVTRVGAAAQMSGLRSIAIPIRHAHPRPLFPVGLRLLGLGGCLRSLLPVRPRHVPEWPVCWVRVVGMVPVLDQGQSPPPRTGRRFGRLGLGLG